MTSGPGTDAGTDPDPGPDPDVAGWTTARRVALAFIAVWLAVQLTVPAAALLVERPVRFSWQMYSGLAEHPSYVLVWDDGEEERETHGALLPWTRADLPYHQHLPQHLCATEDGLEEVRVVPRYDDTPLRTIRCRELVGSLGGAP